MTNLSTPDWAFLLESIERCNAAYVMDDGDARAAFAAMGCAVLGRMSDDAHQALVWTHPQFGKGLTIAGTRVSEGSAEVRAVDLFEDVDFATRALDGSVKVAGRVYDAGRGIYEWAKTFLEPTEAFDIIEGHSKGGWQTTYAPLFLAPTQFGHLIAWEPPKQGNAAFWAKYADALLMPAFLQIVHARDPWFGYPPSIATSLTHGGGPVLFIEENGASWSWTTEADWVGGDLIRHADDHGPTSVITAVRNLAAAQAKIAA